MYIIDSGSFQLEDYSCGVFNADYTSTELKGRNLREVLRTLEDEYFPINKILFEVLMGKGPFYDFQTGEVGSDVERHFHYPMDYNKKVDNQQKVSPLFRKLEMLGEGAQVHEAPFVIQTNGEKNVIVG